MKTYDTAFATVERRTLSDGSHVFDVLQPTGVEGPACEYKLRLACVDEQHAQRLCGELNACTGVDYE